MKAKSTAILRFEEDMYFTYKPELDIASQGQTQRESLDNLKEAVNLFLENASQEESLSRNS